MQNHPSPDPAHVWTRVTRLMIIDRAISFAVAARFWQLLAGPITSLLVVFCFSTLVQGYYVVFLSLLQLQAFVELGTQWAILYVASHEWAQLHLSDDGRIAGDGRALSRLASMTRMARNWFAVAAVVFVVAAGTTGIVLFSAKAEGVPWLAPWVSIMVLAGAGLALSPYISVLEGCDQMATVNRYRLLQAVSGNLVVWSAILLGAQLWVAVIALLMQVLWELRLLAHFRNFWRSLPTDTTDGAISWGREVWPLQWRLAVQSVFRYFAFGLFTPVMFLYHSTEVAARMGMTWLVLTSLQQAAFVWVRTRTPTFGALVTRKEYRRLDRLFFHVTAVSLALLLLALVAFCLAVWAVSLWQHPIAHHLSGRLLDPWSTLIFSAAILLAHLPQCFGVYLRAHKRDPLLWLTVVANSVIGVLVWQLGGRLGVLPAAISFLAVLALVTVPGTAWIWLRCRREWHG